MFLGFQEKKEINTICERQFFELQKRKEKYMYISLYLECLIYDKL
jgi:hypothetical protein